MTDRTGSGPNIGGSTGDDASPQTPAALKPLAEPAPEAVPEAEPAAGGVTRAAVDGLGEVTRGLAPLAERAARGASAAAEPVRVIARRAADQAAAQVVERLARTSAMESVERAAREAAVKIASAAAEKAVREAVQEARSVARTVAGANPLAGTAIEVTGTLTGTAMTLAEQAAQHPMAAAARRLATRNPFARAVTATAVDAVADVAGRTVSAPVVQAATRVVVDTAIDAVADVAVDVALDVGREVIADVVRTVAQEAARQAARELASGVREQGRRVAAASPVAAASADLASSFVLDVARDLGTGEAARAASGFWRAAAGSALARTAAGLAGQVADRALALAVETVMRELMREALKAALRESLRGILFDVAREVVVESVRTGWTTVLRADAEPATAGPESTETARAAGGAPGSAAAEVSLSGLVGRMARATVGAVASHPATGTVVTSATGIAVRVTARTAPRVVPRVAASTLRNASRYRAGVRRADLPERPAASSTESIFTMVTRTAGDATTAVIRTAVRPARPKGTGREGGGRRPAGDA
ncbi:hypothetical protein AB0L06_19625 [Spirillospora sp. NPDC052269]